MDAELSASFVITSLVGDVMAELVRPFVSLESLREVRCDFCEELPPPVASESSSCRFVPFWTLEPSSLELEDDVEDVDVVDELDVGLVVVAMSRFGCVPFDLALLFGECWLTRKSLLRDGF